MINISFTVFQFMTMCSLTGSCQHSGDIYCLHFQGRSEDRGNRCLKTWRSPTGLHYTRRPHSTSKWSAL